METLKSHLKKILPIILKLLVVLIPIGLIYAIYTILRLVLPLWIAIIVKY
jgi:hypothetical protein